MMTKRHIKFPSIEQYRNVIANIKRQHEFVGLDETGEAIYDRVKPKPILTFTGTIKLHGCFEKNTPIMLSNGEEISISEIKIGNSVLSFDINNSEFINNKVTMVNIFESDKDWVELVFSDRKIKCTIDHKFFTKNRGWVEAINLTENDEFITI